MEPYEIEHIPEKEDIEYLQSQLEQTHYDLYRNVDKEIFTEALNKSAEVSPEFFKIAIQESLALLGDAHTHVYEDFRGEELFPVRYREIKGKFYIIGAENNNSDLLGRQIISINGLELSELLPHLSKLSSKENSEVLSRDLAWFLESNKILRYYSFSDKDVVQVETDKGNLELRGLMERNYIYAISPLVWRKEDIDSDPTYYGNRNYQFRVEKGNLIFQYNDCSNEGFTEEYLEKFKKRLLEQSSKVNNIVVDLRLNDGGSTDVMEDLFVGLPSDKPVYVAIARRTFSSAMHHLLYLKLNKGAILIGENAGQRPNRFGDRKDIVLPNSKIKVACSYKYFELLPGEDIDVIKPDISIPVTIEDYINNTDPLNNWIDNNLL